MSDPDSIDIRDLYTRDYYLFHVYGHAGFRDGTGGLETMLNMRRTYEMALVPQLRRALDIGSGRGELARHLVGQGVSVTLVDYSEAAMEIARGYVDGGDLARFLTISATEVARHVERASQDAIFMVDFAEHVSRDELRVVLEQCADVLAPHGVLCLHTPERTSGAVLTRSQVEPKHINLMDVADLQELLSGAFAYAEAFTWNGGQRFREPGRCIELFGIAGHQPPASRTVAPNAQGKTRRRFDLPGLAGDGRCHLRARVSAAQDVEVVVTVRFLGAAGEVVAETVIPARARREEPAELLVVSGMVTGRQPFAAVEIELDDAAAVSLNGPLVVLSPPEVR